MAYDGQVVTRRRVDFLIWDGKDGVLQDILWAARIHPKRKTADLSAEEIGAMFRAVKSVLRDMVEQDGRDTGLS